MGFLADLVAARAKSAQEKLEATLVPKSGWGSRKLWIFAGIAFSLVWLGRGNLVVILDGLIYLTGVYLITQAAHDCVSDAMTAWVKRQEIRSETELEIAKLQYASDTDPMGTPSTTTTKP
jgi:hypothetical protein